MVAAVGAKVPQLRMRSITEGGNSLVSQFRARAVYNFPSVEMRSAQMRMRGLWGSGPMLDVSQLRVRALIKGRVDDPRVRMWTGTIDQHDLVFLRLGNTETLVYDTYSEEWYQWGSGISGLFRAYTGCNWQGGRALVLNYSDVICGDDGNGALYFLSPDHDTDDDPNDGSATQRTFTRHGTGQLIVKPGYAATPCFSVQLYGSIGAGGTDLTVNLQYSDDRGYSWTDAGDITLSGEDYTARCNWRSLGSMTAPGRLFKITDTGALKRIDGLDVS